MLGHNSRYHQQGLSLIEMMLAITLGLGAILSLASVVGYGVGVNGKLLSSNRLTEELNAVGSLMYRDLIRTGYNGDTVAMVADPAASPSPFANSITVSAFPGEAANSCILYAYDGNNNGVLDVVGTNENYGFRLRDDTLEMRVGGAACDAGGWQDLSDLTVVRVTALIFTLNQTTVNNVTSTMVDINLSAELSDNAAFSRVYNYNLLVRNYD
jgi:prepilin peptidase dependent protein B